MYVGINGCFKGHLKGDCKNAFGVIINTFSHHEKAGNDATNPGFFVCLYLIGWFFYLVWASPRYIIQASVGSLESLW